MTPYWDAEGGIAIDATYQCGIPIFGLHEQTHQFSAQGAIVKRTPDWFGSGPIANWLKETRWAFRLGGGYATPTNGQFFTLGGGEQFRGYDLRERQGNATWVGSIEWRIPLYKNVCWDFCDHMGGVRNVYFVPFYDAGNAYLGGRQQGDVAHAFGLGLRIDMAWLGLIERTMIRFDVAKTINDNSPVQFWLGIQHPF